jgi:hypothetical protein
VRNFQSVNAAGFLSQQREGADVFILTLVGVEHRSCKKKARSCDVINLFSSSPVLPCISDTSLLLSGLV